MRNSNYIAITLKVIVVLLFGGILFANWFFIATVILQDIMMGSGFIALFIAFILTFLLSNTLFSFKGKWILSLGLAICSYFIGNVLEAYELNYRSHKHSETEFTLWIK